MILPALGEQCRSGKLCNLDLSEIGLSDRGARKLFETMMSGKFPVLTSLSLAKNELKDSKLNGLIEMLRLDECSITELNVSSNPMPSATLLRSLKFNTTLNALNICSMGAEDAEGGVRDFAVLLLQDGCPCPIKLLSCDEFEVTETTEAINFEGKPTRAGVITLLAGILKLNERVLSLNLSGVGMDVEGARALSVALGTNKTLAHIDLRANDKLFAVTEATDGGGARQAGIEAIAEGLRANTAVKTVYVDDLLLHVDMLKGGDSALEYTGTKTSRLLGDASATLMGLIIEKNGVAESLDLSNCKSAVRLGHAMGRCLRGNTTLLALYLRDTDLGDSGTTVLADGLIQNGASKLAHLDLSSNGIGPAGAASLATLLEKSSSLLKLNLGCNALGPAGADALSAKLSQCKALTSLSLMENEIEEAGGASIGAALKTNTTLSALWLGKNNLKNDGLAAVVDALCANKGSKLAVLDVQKNGLGTAAIKKLGQLLSESASLTALSAVGTKMEFTESESLQLAAKERPELGRAKAVKLWLGADTKNFPEL